jgi:hypothetical protein
VPSLRRHGSPFGAGGHRSLARGWSNPSAQWSGPISPP